jgi:hypothetical protein
MWKWQNQGVLKFGQLENVDGEDGPIGGVVAVGGDDPTTAQRPYAFVRVRKNTDNLSRFWINYWDGRAWQWEDQGMPQYTDFFPSMGAVTSTIASANPDQRPYFFTGAFDALWMNWWDSGIGWQWSNLGRGIPPQEGNYPQSVGVVTVMDSPKAEPRPYTFIVYEDAKLWLNWWDGGKFVWRNQGAPPSVWGVDKAIGVVTVMDNATAAQRPYAFVTGTDGNLWVNWWDGHAWGWTNLSTPPGVLIEGKVGVVTVRDASNSLRRPYAFVTGTDGNLWVKYWSSGPSATWEWVNLGAPPGNTKVLFDDTSGSIHRGCAVTVADYLFAPQRPYIFVTGNDDGNLWVRWWDGHDWDWTNLGKPPGVASLGFAGRALTIKNNLWAPELPYVFVPGDNGELWVNWWG